MHAVLALMLAANGATNGRPTVALIPLRSLGVPADVVRALEVTLRNELSQLPEVKLLPEKDVELDADCAGKLACAAAVAAKAGARELITGTTGQLGDAFTVDLKLVDAHTAQEIRRATYPVTGTQDALIETLHEASVRLLAPARFVGSLRVEVPGAPGAALFIDGKPAGTLPLLTAIDGLAPGQHTLRVQDGNKAREMSTFVEVRFGKTTETRIDLAAARTPVPVAALPAASEAPGQKPAWVRPAAVGALGAGFASLLAGAAFHLAAYSGASSLNQREANNQLNAGDLAGYNAVDRDTHIARGLYVSAAILSLAGAGILYWDLRGDGARY
jgi:hypothetical protein